jgi:hypothetical protein
MGNRSFLHNRSFAHLSNTQNEGFGKMTAQFEAACAAHSATLVVLAHPTTQQQRRKSEFS